MKCLIAIESTVESSQVRPIKAVRARCVLSSAIYNFP